MSAIRQHPHMSDSTTSSSFTAMPQRTPGAMHRATSGGRSGRDPGNRARGDWDQLLGFALTSLPHKKIADDQVWEKVGHRLTLTVTPGRLPGPDGRTVAVGVPMAAMRG